MVLRNLFLLFTAIFFSEIGLSDLCTEEDRRESIKVDEVGRIKRFYNSSYNCTATQIAPNCFITAKHCRAYAKVLEFDVPFSDEDGGLNRSSRSLTYKIDSSSYLYGQSDAKQDDWLLFKVKANTNTGLLPNVNETYPKIKLENPFYDNNDFVDAKISGYGQADGVLNGTLQMGSGVLQRAQENPILIQHNIDSTSGTSGSTIVLKESGEIVGIHIRGGCGRESGGHLNQGILIYNNPELINAINSCVNKF